MEILTYKHYCEKCSIFRMENKKVIIIQIRNRRLSFFTWNFKEFILFFSLLKNCSPTANLLVTKRSTKNSTFCYRAGTKIVKKVENY